MIIQSFVKSDFGFRPVKLEIVLMPGISQIQILGLPDQTIKESSKRIISALRYQGFRIPAGKQVLINLQPNDLKKSSQGLDLAMALGILLESEQIPKDFFDFSKGYCYGTLSLKGEVLTPSDLSLLNYENFNKALLTGVNQDLWHFETHQLKNLAEYANIEIKQKSQSFFQCKQRDFNSELRFDMHLSRLIAIVATGEHPLLIAGAAGCGKTTMVENLATLLTKPSESVFLESKKYWMMMGKDLTQRPIVQPHHSVTPISMIGGGMPIKFGEISLAHGGTLILDELLEFHPLVQSALREPMEKGKIYISRAGGRKTYPCDSLILATTNLCACGNFQGDAHCNCRCSSLKLRNYIQRLTGPFLDRFTIFNIYQKPKIDLKVGLQEIKKQIDLATEFQKNNRSQEIKNNRLTVDELLKQLASGIDLDMLPYTKSHRRQLSLLRVARTLADLDMSENIQQSHLEESKQWTVSDIYKLEKFRMDDFAMR
jgi:magnesium chelatase family protein